MRLRARPSRFVLLLWLVGCFAFSAVTNLWWLGGGFLAMALLLPRQALRAARRTLLSALPLSLAAVVLTYCHARFILHAAADLQAYAALVLRASLIAFASFAVLGATDLLAALAPWPTLSRLLVVTLAQIHALRLLVRESWLGLLSRLVRKPSALDGLRNAGGVTATLLTLSARNARDIADALRARGF
jgi:cobalt/nickel transport system permease protein